MQCPYHKSELEKSVYEEEVEIDSCPTCKGIWLDPGELEQIQRSTENDYSSLLGKSKNSAAMEYNRKRQLEEAPINCPGCATPMSKKEHGLHSKIVVDLCPKCGGIWLDKGELQALEIFYEEHKEHHPKMSRFKLLLAGFSHFSHRS